MKLYEKLSKLLELAGLRLEEWSDGVERVKTQDFSMILPYELVYAYEYKGGSEFCTIQELDNILENVKYAVQRIGNEYYVTYAWRNIKK